MLPSPSKPDPSTVARPASSSKARPGPECDPPTYIDPHSYNARASDFVGRSWQWTRGSALLAGVGDDAAYVAGRIAERLPATMDDIGGRDGIDSPDDSRCRVG